ncbi:site-specific DNA-methyltransferase [Pseudomonas sp. C27(2019)]|uniref:site-specific DNA-methyltransferase n=1 Tax=Pseudomonas sp. C27(2019) TaxID=2604941 RepID=UPI0012470A97|nr:site-specific DNA-methyltransferase [Pseudomonas sp. C27(2019)]QEY59729.1 site-specific DNA-methyltransferase [Pseudomonas sp. C27(2019)]
MPILHWLNKDQAVTAAQKSTYRLLEEVPELSYGDADNENLLIQGDNLEALKALIPFYAGKVKCIFIDPPYNTKSAFEHYDDNLEHSKWLSMIYPRLELLRELLSEDGSIWITIDDHEAHYLKVICDEVFGRSNFIANTVWQRKFAPQNDAKLIDANHDNILVFAKNINIVQINLLPRSAEMDARYKNPDKDPRGPWTSGDSLRREFREYAYYEITTPSGRKVLPPPGSSWRFNKEEVPRLIAENRLWFGVDGTGVPRIKRFLSDVKQGVIAQTIWPHTDVGNTQEAKKEIIKFNSSDIFDTPKPERLMQRVLHLATNPNDLVLDSFLGSGTTAAVAHKMNRRYIGIEMGEHAQTHCQTRLKKVVDGEQGGISKTVDWQGGGGFRFFKLGEAVFDEYGSLNTAIKFPTLAAHIWYLENKTPLQGSADNPLLGIHNGTAYYLLYNGILGDRRPQGGNVLTSAVLNELPDIQSQQKIVIYGESCRLGSARLQQANITFKQIPYDVGML